MESLNFGVGEGRKKEPRSLKKSRAKIFHNFMDTVSHKPKQHKKPEENRVIVTTPQHEE